MDKKRSINCRGKLLDLSEPIVMGILNITPDSFYDGGKANSPELALNQCAKMLKAGASIIDLGGMSSRPGARLIPVKEEIERILPVLKILLKEFPEIVISIDSLRAEVLRVCLEEGAHIINDISAASIDPEIVEITARYSAPYVLMHMQNSPENMQDAPTYQDLLTELMDFFISKIGELRKAGIVDIIIDPGFGFGKTVEHNFKILKHLKAFQILGEPVLAGISRKSMICKVLKVNPKDALNGTTALHMEALRNGADILRVHDVEEAVQTIKLWKQLIEV